MSTALAGTPQAPTTPIASDTSTASGIPMTSGTPIAAALADRSRPLPPSAVSTAVTFGWRAMRKIRHAPEQLADAIVLPVIATLMFTFLFGGALAGSSTDYVQFLIPGILTQGVIMLSMYTGITLRNDLDKGIFDRFRSLPIWRPAPLVGMLLGDAVRFAVAATVTVVLGLVLGWRPAGGFVGVVTGVALVLVFAFAIGWVWTFLSLTMRSAAAVSGVSTMVILPLTFVSNIFVDPATMPGWLRTVVEINPVTHLVTAVRAVGSGTVAGVEIALTLGGSLGLIAVFGTLTMLRYRSAH